MRAQLARPHTPQIFFLRDAMPGRSQALDRWSYLSAVSRWFEWQILDWRWFAGLAPPTREHDSTRVRRESVEQLDLHADDGPEARLRCCSRKSNRAIQALVVSQSDRAEPQLNRALGQVIDARGTVEEREVGVAVQLGECARHSGILEQMF